MASKHRTVIHDEAFARELADCVPDEETRESICEGLEWVLSRRPGIGRRIETSQVFALNYELPESPLVVFYTFTTTEVHLLSVQQSSPPDV
ncbi:MAG TPA: hypothetical protein VGP72_04590 [Planctomycetota bacterium]|jgi:hypothetical protein